MTEIERSEPLDSIRFTSIDVFKGLSIALMVFVNTLSPFDMIPSWTHHAGEYGLTYVDLIAPFFIFMLALNFTLSFKRHLESNGRRKAYMRHLRRYLIFIGIGLFMFIDVSESGIILRWGTLQVLGMSGLLFLPIAEAKSSIKLIIGLFYVTIHQILLSTPLSMVIYDSIEGGILGCLSWGSMMIFSSVLAEGLRKNDKRKYFLMGGALFMIIGLITSFFWRISRGYMTLPYVFISVGASSILYYMLYLLFEQRGRNPPFKNEKILSPSGKNAFILFLIHIITLYIFYEAIPFLYVFLAEDLKWVVVIFFALLNVCIILLIGYILDKCKIYLVI
jgi:predicted acyltransferase